MGKDDWEEAFSLIDEAGTGAIPTTKFGQAVRCAGGYPTEENLKDMIGRADPKGEGFVSKDAFLKECAWVTQSNPAVLEELCASFQVFDKEGNGTINKVEMVHILTSMGDKLSADEAEEFAKEAEVDKEGMIDYKKFLSSLLNG